MKNIKAHSQYNAEDYTYFRAKGWTNSEIISRWDEEAAAGNVPCRWDGYFAQTKYNAVTSK